MLPTVILPGYLAGARDYYPLEQALQQLGFPTLTVPLRRRNWLATVGGRPVTPILEILDRTVKQVLQQYQTSQINLIGHSAGGWISRIYLGDKPYCDRVWHAQPQVATLLTLGTPHQSCERWTKRNLDFVNTSYPGAFYPDVRYICVAGKAIYGEPIREWAKWRGVLREENSSPEGSLGEDSLGTFAAKWFSYKSYELTVGHGDCWGDGITPIAAAHLAGAKNLVLEGVMHSPKVTRGRVSLVSREWYGSPEPLQVWVPYLA